MTHADDAPPEDYERVGSETEAASAEPTGEIADIAGSLPLAPADDPEGGSKEDAARKYRTQRVRPT